MSAATTAIGTSAADFAAFINAQALLVGAALALVGGVVLAVGIVRRKLGLSGGLRRV